MPADPKFAAKSLLLAITDVRTDGHNAGFLHALKYAIDRKEIAKKVFLGHDNPGNDNPIASSIRYAVDPKPVCWSRRRLRPVRGCVTPSGAPALALGHRDATHATASQRSRT